MRRSIRWTLVSGNAVLLAGVMASFGSLLYIQVRDSTLEYVDGELRAQAQAVAGAMKETPESRFEISLSDAQVRYFQASGSYVIWNRRGEIVDYTDPGLSGDSPMEAGARTVGTQRDLAIAGPAGSRILVRRSIQPQLDHLGKLRTVIIGIGLLIFAVGFLGGWLLIGRLLNPIRRITATAESISEKNLSERIDVSATEDELGDLARTLNSAFGRLESAMNRMSRFTADASHELRTPISVLMTQLELGLKRDRPSAEYREVMETCLKAVRRMAALAEGLLFLSRADAKALELRRESLDLKQVIEESVDLVLPMAKSRGIRLSVDATSQPMVGDRVRLGEAVTNLVTNAIQYNRPRGEVEVSLKDGILSVSDTGPGISEGDRPHVFERFYRADKSRSRKDGGAGLGLAITKSIVEAHGGTIDFESRNGCGTVFRIHLQPGKDRSA